MSAALLALIGALLVSRFAAGVLVGHTSPYVAPVRTVVFALGIGLGVAGWAVL